MNMHDWVQLCDAERVAVIQFNCGHWDAARFDSDRDLAHHIATYLDKLI